MSAFLRAFGAPTWRWPYEPDHRDRVVALHDVPQSDIGAPLPMMVAGEGVLHIAFALAGRHPPSGEMPRFVTVDSDDRDVAVVTFQHPCAHLFGPPNDEAFEGHPLASRGLEPYGAFEVENSSWIRALERMNAVHEHHRPERILSLRHFVLSFHDSCFECAARGFRVAVAWGSIRAIALSAAAGPD